jgi:hypothetical protein
MNDNQFTRICPKCGKISAHKTEHDLNSAKKRNRPCRKCNIKNWQKAGWETMRRNSKPLRQRFWAKVDIKKSVDRCWNWTGNISKKTGYPHYSYLKEKKIISVYAHRFAYTLIIGEIPKGFLLHHTCENAICCNPSHLVPMQHSPHHKLHQWLRRGHPVYIEVCSVLNCDKGVHSGQTICWRHDYQAKLKIEQEEHVKKTRDRFYLRSLNTGEVFSFYKHRGDYAKAREATGLSQPQLTSLTKGYRRKSHSGWILDDGKPESSEFFTYKETTCKPKAEKPKDEGSKISSPKGLEKSTTSRIRSVVQQLWERRAKMLNSAKKHKKDSPIS